MTFVIETVSRRMEKYKVASTGSRNNVRDTSYNYLTIVTTFS